MESLLYIDKLSAGYGGKKILSNINLSVKPKEILGIVGESGSGKSTLLKAIMQIPNTGIEIFSGSIVLEGKDLSTLTKEESRKMKGDHLGIVFQNPGSSLNPTRKILPQFIETLRSHKTVDKKEAKKEIIKLFESLHLKDPERILNSYPFELSGGMSQRVALALAMIFSPELLLADEPTSALDAMVQDQVLNEMMKLRDRFHTSIIIITHDFSVVEKMADNIAIMCDGNILEWGEKGKILSNPIHPYTQALLNCVPKINGKIPMEIDYEKFDYGALESITEKEETKWVEQWEMYEVELSHLVKNIRIER